jgi:non-homologous end joining protein Ku
VVRLAHKYFSVMNREDDKPVRVERWPSRAGAVYRKEYLQSYGCEDHEYSYVDREDFLL